MSDLILGPLPKAGNSWYETTLLERARFHGEACPVVPPTDPVALDKFVMLQYYDLPWTEYAAHQMTGDPKFLVLARKCADAWWKHPTWIREGLERDVENGKVAPPRHAGIGGLILRAKDDRPDMWDYVNFYVRSNLNKWVLSKLRDPEPSYVREAAFMLLYAAWLSRELPNTFVLQDGGSVREGATLRALYKSDCEVIATQYFSRLQHADGSWRWDDTDSRQDDGGTLVGITQPFIVGFILQALIAVHQVSDSETVKTDIRRQLSKACANLYLDGPFSRLFIPALNTQLDGFHYFYYGGTTVKITRYAAGDLPADPSTYNRDTVQNARQAIATIVAAFGYLFKITGNAFFKTAGDRLWEAAYGPVDGIRNYMAGDAKSLNQNRFAILYPVWTKETSMPTESPDNTKAETITDSHGAVWTLGPKDDNGFGATLRNGVAMRGKASGYKYVSSINHALGTDGDWYAWVDASSRWESIGSKEPGVIEPPKLTDPFVGLTWPTSVDSRLLLLGKKKAQGYRFVVIDGGTAYFEKVG